MDSEIKEYFDKAKKEDEALAAPDFRIMMDNVPKRRFPWKLTVGVVAIIVAAAIWFSYDQANPELAPELREDPAFESDFLIVADSDLMEWQSETDYLLDY